MQKTQILETFSVQHGQINLFKKYTYAEWSAATELNHNLLMNTYFQAKKQAFKSLSGQWQIQL